MFMRAAWASININALKHNVTVIRQLVGRREDDHKILAILKANAYGHGLTRIAKALDDVDAIGVARVDEALALRNDGVVKPIVLLEGFFAAEQIELLAANQLQPVIHTELQLQQLEQAPPLPTPLKVWLKVDTGMHRIGVDPEQAEEFYQRLLNCSNVSGEPVLMSHFACADEPKHPKNQQQLGLFQQLTKQLRAITSMANSAAVLAGLVPDCNWVRPGLAIYGISPFTGKQSKDLGLQPVMTLQASVISTRVIDAGETVGYGAAWTAKRRTKIGIVAIGYGDGYPRHAPEGTPVWIDGVRYPLVGRVSMDMIAVELGCDSQVEIGATGVLWGPQLPVEEIADWVGTIPYELLCNVARRVVLDYGD